MGRIVLAIVAAAALALAGAALAITNGGPDGNGHPEVGELLAQQAFSDGTWEECTGDADLADRVPDRGALRRGRAARRGDVRVDVRPEERQDLLGHLARRPGVQPGA